MKTGAGTNQTEILTQDQKTGTGLDHVTCQPEKSGQHQEAEEDSTGTSEDVIETNNIRLFFKYYIVIISLFLLIHNIRPSQTHKTELCNISLYTAHSNYSITQS